MEETTPSDPLATAGRTAPTPRWRLRTALVRVVKISTCGSAFAGFGIGWVLLSFLVLPVIWVWPGSLAARRLRTQRVICAVWVFFHDYMRWLGLFDFNPRRVPTLNAYLRQQGIEGPVVVVANHPSLIDVTSLVSALGPMCFIVKASLAQNPVFGPLLRLTGQISADAGDGHEGVVEQAVERLRAGHHVLLFPEGTRSPPGRTGRFRLGAFEIARQAGVPVVPIAVRVTPPSLYKGLPWYRIADHTIRGRVRLLRPLEIDTNSVGVKAARELRERAKASIAETLAPGTA